MRVNLLLLLLVGVMLQATAQTPLPNSGFENWTSNGPENWNTNNINGTFEAVTVSTDARSGAFAVKGAATVYAGNTLSPNLGTYSGSPFAVTQQHATLNFYYKMHRGNNTDGLVIAGTIYDASNNVVGLISHKISAERNTYTAVSIPIIWVGSNPADMNLLIGFEDTTGSGTVGAGGYYLLDDISLGGFISGVEETEANLPPVSVFPNPSTGNAWTITTDKQWLGSTLTLLNTEGRLVYNGLVNEEVNTLGDNLPAGVYTLQIASKQYAKTLKLIKN